MVDTLIDVSVQCGDEAIKCDESCRKYSFNINKFSVWIVTINIECVANICISTCIVHSASMWRQNNQTSPNGNLLKYHVAHIIYFVTEFFLTRHYFLVIEKDTSIVYGRRRGGEKTFEIVFYFPLPLFFLSSRWYCECDLVNVNTRKNTKNDRAVEKIKKHTVMLLNIESHRRVYLPMS